MEYTKVVEVTEAVEEPTYVKIDIKFINKYKKFIIDHVVDYAGMYLKLIRPTNDKRVEIDAHAKDQIMYILYKLIDVAVSVDKDVPDDIPEWVEQNLDVSSSEYKIYKFVTGATINLKYNLMCEPIEEETLAIIAEHVKDEDVMQHTVELFLLFIKKFAECMANFSWASTKKISSLYVCGLLRNMNNNNTNPDIFVEIYEFAKYCKVKNAKI